MLKDVFVCGSSIASGQGKGKVQTTAKIGNQYMLKSWVQYLAEYAEADNLWNFSMSAKPVGLTTSDTRHFLRQYWEKYRTYEKLFIILEYTIPQYRHWDPVAMTRKDTKESIEVIPITYFRSGKNSDHVLQINRRDPGMLHVAVQYLSRDNDFDMVNQNSKSAHNLYTTVKANDIDKQFVDEYRKKATDWLSYDSFDEQSGKLKVSEKKMMQFFKYASDEIYGTKHYLENFNIPYLMLWAGGQTDQYCKTVDRYFAKLMKTKRMIPMTTFTCNKASLEWSIKPYGPHPDDTGHRRIAEFLYDWIKEHKLYEKPNNSIATGYGDL